MKQFKFASNTIELDFEGKIYTLPNNAELLETLKAAGERLIDPDRNLDQLTEDELTDEMMDTIDMVLGEGAADDIFEGREPNVYDCCDVVTYIKERIVETREERAKKYTGDAPEKTMNRQQRRAAARTRRTDQ